MVVDDIHTNEVNSDIPPIDVQINGNGSNGNGYSKGDITNYDLIIPKSELTKLPRPQLIKLANKYKLSNYMSMTANKLAAALAGKVKQSDVEQLLSKSSK